MALALDLSTDALRDLLGGRLRSSTPRRVWASLRAPDLAGTDDVSVLGGRVPLATKRSCRAGLRIAGPEHEDDAALEVPSPDEALAVLVVHLASKPAPDAWWDEGHVVQRFGEIARFARIHRSADIGDGCRIGAGVVIHENVRIGPGSVLCDHVTVGSPGFGLHRRLPSPDWLLLPHRAGAHLDANVFLGPHVNVAAGLIEPTWIGAGCRIDALVQIGHNARIGARCVFAGQSGVAGSAEIGAECMIGGQAAISDHVRLGQRCRVAARAGVTKSWGDDVVLRGFPARPTRGADRVLVGRTKFREE